MNKAVNQISLYFIGFVFGFYTIAMMMTGGVTRHIVVQHIHRHMYEVWPMVVFFVSMLLLTRVHFLIVVPVMLVLAELYQVLPADSFEKVMERLADPYSRNFPRFIISTQVSTAWLCVFMVSLADVTNRAGKYNKMGGIHDHESN